MVTYPETMKLYNYPMLLLIAVFFILGAFCQGWENLYGFSSGDKTAVSYKVNNNYNECNRGFIYSSSHTDEDSLLVNPSPLSPNEKIASGHVMQSQVEVMIVSSDGNAIRDLILDTNQFNQRPVYWDKRDNNGYLVLPGIYYCLLKVDEITISKRILLIR
jgi:hypothetical protein